jgi:hypothetical protein
METPPLGVMKKGVTAMNKILCVVFILLCSDVFAEDCQHHSEHEKQVDQRGNHVMGFDHKKTTHHFLLKPDGGIIIADAKNADDRESISKIRKHFAEITVLFSRGEFSKPKEIHDRVPPGVPEMIRLRDQIVYSFHETEKGGEVRMKTANEQALKAIHAFLRFQIEDHHTGDSATVP